MRKSTFKAYSSTLTEDCFFCHTKSALSCNIWELSHSFKMLTVRNTLFSCGKECFLAKLSRYLSFLSSTPRGGTMGKRKRRRRPHPPKSSGEYPSLCFTASLFSLSPEHFSPSLFRFFLERDRRWDGGILLRRIEGDSSSFLLFWRGRKEETWSRKKESHFQSHQTPPRDFVVAVALAFFLLDIGSLCP